MKGEVVMFANGSTEPSHGSAGLKTQLNGKSTTASMLRATTNIFQTDKK